MQAKSVDPRDIDVEWDATEYRVYFWAPDGSRCEEYKLSGAGDVREVVRWADAAAGDRLPEIFVRHDEPSQQGLIRLAGRRPGVV